MPILRLEVVEEVGQLFVLLFEHSAEGGEMIVLVIGGAALWYFHAPTWAYVLLAASALAKKDK